MTRAQQKCLNACLGDLAEQIPWSVNGIMRPLSKDDWRRFFAAHVRRQPMCPSIEGDFMVVLSVSTKGFSKREASIFIELVKLFGDQRHVAWQDPSLLSQMVQLQEGT